MKLFRGSSGPETIPSQGSQKLTRRSSGLGELSRGWDSAENLCVLDLGSTSPTNIRHFTGNGHRIYSEDLLTASTDPELATKDEQGTPHSTPASFSPKTWFIRQHTSMWCCAGTCRTIWPRIW